ncbi:hypothetical protein Mgra_00008417 [Meloidogyne graminicola]|uniref:Transmembrane protein 138 n=1 Tax=Meloidogyne graminicola TaxID=189291 RepID=A0A8S9ZFV4_9BILA|nr:hypothetical protein Mgra_00008417 [Meloidogyne graminicola]
MFFLLLVLPLDLLFNSANSFLYYDNNIKLMIILFQDTIQILSIFGLAIYFSSTFVFQAGLIGYLLKRFSYSIFIILLYLILSILYHFFSLKDSYLLLNNNNKELKITITTILFLLQRIVAIFYYFSYKRTILMLSDPKYHSESEWLFKKIGKCILN